MDRSNLSNFEHDPASSARLPAFVLAAGAAFALAACGDPAQSVSGCPAGQVRIDNTCVFEAIAKAGCTNSRATNFDPAARIDDGSCQLPPGAGCTDARATNYDPNATSDDGSCDIPGCTVAGAVNTTDGATRNDGSCRFELTLSVDLNDEDGFDPADGIFVSGSFNDFCGTCEALDDTDSDGVWEGTLQVPAGMLEYKFVKGPAPGAGTPEVVPLGCDANEDPDFDARGIEVIDAAVTAELTPFGSCPGLELPFTVDLYYVPSGLFGDGEDGFVTMATNCPTRAPDPVGTCHQVQYGSGGNRGFAGAFWQYPGDNFGALPGLEIPQGATRVSFYAWSQGGGERVKFLTGINNTELPNPDGFAIETDFITMTNTPTEYAIFLDNVTYDQVVGAFGWVSEGPMEFYIDKIQWVRNPDDVNAGVRGCTNPNASNFDPAAMTDNGSCVFAVTFDVDMSCSGLASFTNVFVTGPFCGFCDAGFQLTDPDSDGRYVGTFDFPAGDLEFKYMVDGFAAQEDLLDDVLAGGMCAPVTDGANFANRQISVSTDGANTYEHTYGSCTPCGM